MGKGRLFKRIVSPNERDRQLAGGSRLAPGFWVDRTGGLHVSVVELLEIVGLPNTPENREQVTQMAVEMMRRSFPDADLTVPDERDH